MGGDGGSAVAVQGARLALAADPDLAITLVGRQDELSALLDGTDEERLQVHHAAQVLAHDVKAAVAIRRGRDSSLWMALHLLEKGEVDAMVSGGSTGALMALSRQKLGMLPGVERPALMAALPTVNEPAWLLDLGANINVDAPRLLEFAQLGHVAFQVIEGRAPSIGLLNIGSEPGKGPDVIREAARLIQAEASLGYAGFVEANQVFTGKVDLVVCDGFAGNVLLKSAEGAVHLMFNELRRQLQGKLSGLLVARQLRRLHDRLDPARHNGAPMLGVRGTVIKSHGSSCSHGFARALSLAAVEVRSDLINRLEQQLWASYERE